MREIWHEIVVNCTPERLFEAVSSSEAIAHWWTIGATGDGTEGGTLEFWFSGFRATVARVERQEAPLYILWRICDGELKDWLGTEIEFCITPSNGRSMLHLRHTKWSDEASSFPHCSFGWATFLLSLKEYAETGKGRPFPYDLPINLWTPPDAVEAVHLEASQR